MRLPWPLSRLQRAPAPGSAAPPSAPTRAESGKREDWRDLPALAETIGPPPLIAPTAQFAADLGAGNPPPPFLAPLAHARGLDAPSGIVLGIARPVVRDAAESEPRPPLQRRPAGRRASQAADVSLMETAQPEPAAAQLEPVAGAPIASVPLAGPRRLAVAMTGVQRAPATLARLSERDRAALPVRTGFVGQPKAAGGLSLTSAAALPMPSPATPSAIPQSPLPQLAMDSGQTLPLPGPISRKPQGEPRAAPEPSPITAGRPTLGQSRRLGLGSPLATVPTTAKPVAATERPTSLPLSAPARVQRKPEAAQTARTPVVNDKAVSPAAPPSASGPVVARPMPAMSARPTATPTVPLISARPLRASVQRAPVTSARSRVHDEAERDEGSQVNRSPVKVHRGGVAADLSESLDAKAFTHQGEIYLPPSAGPMGSPTARSLIAHEMTHVAQQRAYGSRLPQEHTSHGQELEQKAAAAERHPELPLAPTASRPGAASAPTSDEMAATAQRKPADPPRAAAVNVETSTINFPGHIQRAKADNPTKSAPAATAESGNGKKSETELEELAGQLYGRISRRLRRELLVDRERAGLMVDLP